MRRLGRLAALLIGAASLGTIGATALLTAPASAQSGCDHFDNGRGNLGDPGNGGSHHNEDQGRGNNGDPGNAGKKACGDE